MMMQRPQILIGKGIIGLPGSSITQAGRNAEKREWDWIDADERGLWLVAVSIEL